MDGVDFNVEKGEFVAIVGTSGSGKSTLLNMLGGLDIPTSGEIKIQGKKLSDLNDEQLTIFRRRNIGFIFQNYNLLPMLNVYENIVLPIELDGQEVDQTFLNEIINMLGLQEKLKSMCSKIHSASDGTLIFPVLIKFIYPHFIPWQKSRILQSLHFGSALSKLDTAINFAFLISTPSLILPIQYFSLLVRNPHG